MLDFFSVEELAFPKPNGRFYTRGRIMHLDELGQTFVIRLVIRT